MPTAVEITWRGTRPVTADQLAYDKEWAHEHGYPVFVWCDVNAAYELVILTRVMSSTGGSTVALYETAYTKD